MSTLPTRSGCAPARALAWGLPFLLASLSACLEYPEPSYGGAGDPAGAYGGEGRPATTDAQAGGEGAAPTYYGYRVYFDRWGRPMFYSGGSWRYVPPSAPGYAWYRQYWLRQRGAGARPEATTRPPTSPATPGGRSQTYSDFESAPTSPPPARGGGTVPPPAPGEPDRPPPAGPGGSYDRSPSHRAPSPSASTWRRAVPRPTAAPQGRWGEGRSFDASGRYRGRTDSDGRTYDSSGRYQGRTDRDGRTYDSSGRYQGRTDRDGRSYDASGRYVGRVDRDGRYYDASGRYQGRVDKDGRLYDASGRYRGRVSR